LFKTEVMLSRVSGNFSWGRYRAWLQANDHDHDSEGQTHPPDGPVFVAHDGTSPEDKDLRLLLEPVAGTEVGIYGADRYVAPDLPGYYEYRAIAWSTAGRRSSPMARTGWVAPLYDEKRQRPNTVGAEATYDSGKPNEFTIKLLLIHPLFHMRKALRSLWIGADARVQVDDADMPLGLLPDLALSYQIFVWQNFNPKDISSGVTPAPVYVPLARVLPPTLTDGPWFQSECQYPGLAIENTDEFTPTVQRVEANDQKQDGGLWLQLQFSKSGPASDGLLAMLRDAADKLPPEGFAPLFPIYVERGGVRSELVPRPPSAT
jgi:hypothetical protein